MYSDFLSPFKPFKKWKFHFLSKDWGALIDFTFQIQYPLACRLATSQTDILGLKKIQLLFRWDINFSALKKYHAKALVSGIWERLKKKTKITQNDK